MKKAECLDKQDLLLYRVRQKNSPRQHYDFCYSVLHQFRQAGICLWWFDFQFNPILKTAVAAKKMMLSLKSSHY
jgi:hypothetical protein